MEIKDVTEISNIEVVAALAKTIWVDHYTPIIGAAQVAYMLDKFQSEDAIRQQINEGYHYSAAFVNGEPAGYCATRYEPDHRRVFLSKLYVSRHFRQRGLASALLAHHINALGEKAADSVWLTVNRYNENSIAVYKRMGFVISNTLVSDIGNGYVMDDYRMEKSIL